MATGAAEPRSWNRPYRPYDLDDLKGVVELLCRDLGFGQPTYVAADKGYPLHPGRSAIAHAELIRQGGSAGRAIAAVIGELHPDAIERWDLRSERVVAAEVSIAGLSAGRLPAVRIAPVPRFQAVERDIAVVVASARPAAAVATTIRAAAGELLSDLRLFDVYPMDAGERSLAFRLTFQAPDRTLTDAEIDQAMQAVRRALEDGGGRVRT